MFFLPPPSTSRIHVGSQRITCIFNICSCLCQDRKDCCQQNDQSLRNSPSTSEIFSSGQLIGNVDIKVKTALLVHVLQLMTEIR